jgi:hypothetical protein
MSLPIIHEEPDYITLYSHAGEVRLTVEGCSGVDANGRRYEYETMQAWRDQDGNWWYEREAWERSPDEEEQEENEDEPIIGSAEFPVD